ncbi:hypothetical protein D9M71_349770 [compost metagenome]
MLLLPRFVGGYSGTMVESMGYERFFLLTAILGIPTLLLILWLWGQRKPEPAPVSAEKPGVAPSEQQSK